MSYIVLCLLVPLPLITYSPVTHERLDNNFIAMGTMVAPWTKLQVHCLYI